MLCAVRVFGGVAAGEEANCAATGPWRTVAAPLLSGLGVFLYLRFCQKWFLSRLIRNATRAFVFPGGVNIL